MKVIDVSGLRFGRLVVLGRAENNAHGEAYWLCLCDCGTTCVVRGVSMRSGKSKSCGCLAVEAIGNRRRKHGESKTRLYRAWTNMIDRCYKPRFIGYQWYGGKGVRVCEEWHDFGCFRAWSLSNGYEEPLSLDRMNSSGNYTPDNCRWIPFSDNVRRASIARHIREGHNMTQNRVL